MLVNITCNRRAEPDGRCPALRQRASRISVALSVMRRQFAAARKRRWRGRPGSVAIAAVRLGRGAARHADDRELHDAPANRASACSAAAWSAPMIRSSWAPGCSAVAARARCRWCRSGRRGAVRGRRPRCAAGRRRPARAIASRCSAALSARALCQAWPVGKMRNSSSCSCSTRRLRQRHVGAVRRIEGAAEDAEARRAAVKASPGAPESRCKASPRASRARGCCW